MDNRIIIDEKTGIAAPASVWVTFGATVYSNTEIIGGYQGHTDGELLYLGIAATGAKDERAVVWAMAERWRRGEERTRATARARMADAIASLATSLRAESADELVRRLPDKIRPYVEAVLHARGRG